MKNEKGKIRVRVMAENKLILIECVKLIYHLQAINCACRLGKLCCVCSSLNTTSNNLNGYDFCPLTTLIGRTLFSLLSPKESDKVKRIKMKKWLSSVITSI